MTSIAIEADGLGDRYHFLIRRLHSLSGIVPIGAFLCVHLSVNAALIAGPEAFQYAVDQIHNLANLGILKPVEVLFIFLPIAFHAIVGVMIWLDGRPNPTKFHYCGGVRYALQRWTGIAAMVFILVHLWHVHWIIPGGVDFDAHTAAASAFNALQADWAGPVYAVGLLCAVFHLANGVWTFLITWGVTIGPKSQVRSGWICGALGIVLTLLGMGSLFTLRNMEPPTSAATTTVTNEAH